MRIHNPLDKILNNETKVKILRFLCNKEVELSGRQIAEEVKVSPATCHKSLQELNNEQVLLLRSKGKTHLYRLNKGNIIISDLFKPLFEKESKIPDEMYKIIINSILPTLKNNIVSMAVFGSKVKGKERPTSDIDLLVVVKNPEDKREVEENFENVNEKIIYRFGNTISTYIQTIDEFKLKYKNNLSLIINILKSHKLLYGKHLEELL